MIKMSKKLFSKEEIEKLQSNKFVKNITTKAITYTDELKKVFVSEYEKGVLPRKIFENCGFDIEIIGMKRLETSGKRWRKKYKENGITGLKDTRKGNSGRPLERELSISEQNERLKVENMLLKAENELLKKLEMMERGLIIVK